MLKRIVEWSIWPLCLVANTAPVVAAAMLAPHLVPQVAAATTLVLIFVLLAIEQVLPYRADWSARGDRKVWRDVGHAFAYAALAINAARVLFLGGLASGLSALGLADPFGIWPTDSPVWLQIVLVIVLVP